MGSKEFWFRFDKLVENARNWVSLNDTGTFMLNVIIVFFVNVLLMCNLFGARGILFQIETSSEKTVTQFCLHIKDNINSYNNVPNIAIIYPVPFISPMESQKK